MVYSASAYGIHLCHHCPSLYYSLQTYFHVISYHIVVLKSALHRSTQPQNATQSHNAVVTYATPTNNESKRILCARNATKLCVFHVASKFTILRKTIELVPIEAYNISWEIICLLYNFLCLYRSYGSCIIYTAKVKSTKSRCSVIELHKLINR